MKLLDKPMERLVINSEIDSLDGNVARICVSDSIEEIISSLGFAVDRLNMLAYSRIKELTHKED